MPTPDPASASHHVVAIDDGPDILEHYHAVLANAGCRVSGLPVRDADPDALRSLDPDVVLLGYGLREEGPGWELLLRLRRDPGTTDLPVVVYTTAVAVRPGPEDDGRLKDLGVGVVATPFDIDRLETEVRVRLPNAGGRRSR